MYPYKTFLVSSSTGKNFRTPRKDEVTESLNWFASPLISDEKIHSFFASGPPELIEKLRAGLEEAWNQWTPKSDPLCTMIGKTPIQVHKTEGVNGMKIEKLGEPTVYVGHRDTKSVLDTLINVPAGHPKLVIM